MWDKLALIALMERELEKDFLFLPIFMWFLAFVYGGIQIRPDTEEPEDADEDKFFLIEPNKQRRARKPDSFRAFCVQTVC